MEIDYEHKLFAMNTQMFISGVDSESKFVNLTVTVLSLLKRFETTIR